MSDVSFNEEPTYRYASSSSSNGATGFSGFLIRNKIVKNEQGAQYVLIGFSIVAIVTALIIFFSPSSQTVKKVPPLVPVPPGTA